MVTAQAVCTRASGGSISHAIAWPLGKAEVAHLIQPKAYQRRRSRISVAGYAVVSVPGAGLQKRGCNNNSQTRTPAMNQNPATTRAPPIRRVVRSCDSTGRSPLPTVHATPAPQLGFPSERGPAVRTFALLQVAQTTPTDSTKRAASHPSHDMRERKRYHKSGQDV